MFVVVSEDKDAEDALGELTACLNAALFARWHQNYSAECFTVISLMHVSSYQIGQ